MAHVAGLALPPIPTACQPGQAVALIRPHDLALLSTSVRARIDASESRDQQRACESRSGRWHWKSGPGRLTGCRRWAKISPSELSRRGPIQRKARRAAPGCPCSQERHHRARPDKSGEVSRKVRSRPIVARSLRNSDRADPAALMLILTRIQAHPEIQVHRALRIDRVVTTRRDNQPGLPEARRASPVADGPAPAHGRAEPVRRDGGCSLPTCAIRPAEPWAGAA